MRDSDPLLTPHTPAGNVIVIGDAAHAIMPTIGMGASLAIEDAEDLARRVCHAVKAAPTSEAFRRQLRITVSAPFAAARVPVWQELVQRTRTAAVGNFIRVGVRNRFAIGPQIPNNALSRVVSAVEWVGARLGV